MLGVRLYMLQRITALLMAPLVLGHIAVMIYAVQGGISAAEILGRTQGSVLWALFYGTFVVAVALHAAIGLRVILYETVGAGRGALGVMTAAVFLGLAGLGLRAVYAVTVPGGTI